ncbi:GSCOCT00013377001.2-RA-CDS [Cotesia congregata]|uniref:Cc_bv8.13_11.3b n=2 Tax=root TaxID=1 RepID=S6CWP2_COTCN|nr:GSCOCT00013377001.2-RA-CDS [Cotesia congregata]CAG5075267.1 cc_bv8.13_11.3b [Cotesia congregata]CCQ71338.1 hypothetical protein BV8-13 [Cotesia congregata]
MFDQYAIIMHERLDLIYMVLNEWPARAEVLLMNLVEKIIEQFEFSSPIVRINDVPTRLIRYSPPGGVYYVFERVAKKEIIGAYAYDIVVPEDGGAIRLEITSGSTLSPAIWSPPPLQRTVGHVDQIYRYFCSLKLR